MKKSFIIIGLGRFGANIAKVLADHNCDFIAVDINEESVRNVSKYVNNCVIADGTSLNVLTELGAQKIDHAVVCIGNNLQASILTVINLKKLNVKKITVRADEPSHEEVFRALGADEVIIPEEDSAKSLGNQIMSDSILDYYGVSDDYAMMKVQIGDNVEPKTLIELDLRNNYNINIVGIIRNNKFFIPKGSDKLKPKDVTVVVGKEDKVFKFDNAFNK